jgi:hypothetical protein
MADVETFKISQADVFGSFGEKAVVDELSLASLGQILESQSHLAAIWWPYSQPQYSPGY